MIDHNKLNSFWEKNVPEKFKHFLGSEWVPKAKPYEKDLKDKLLRNINFADVCIALDWGCGGGLGAKLLAEHSEVIILDIAKDSLDECKQFLERNGKSIRKKILLKNLDSFKLDEKIDLIFCASVIQHFPSFEYWQKIVRLWNKINPKWLAIQIRHGEVNQSNESSYFESERNYILGLILTTDEVINSFKDYELVCNELVDDNYSMYEYFVFKKKDC
ncbi:MAG: class I SAM-dependent methyltransferase [Candidatus Omnitrophica bacterium]|nr:class I SAM-dependent methyltransferase [Candidatus Omnitrophota bacterium]